MSGIKSKLAIIGCGNIGTALANGLVTSKLIKPAAILVTRRGSSHLQQLAEKGFTALESNAKAVAESGIVILAVTPQHLDEVIESIREVVSSKHILISLIPGISILKLKEMIGRPVAVVRAMPNTAIAIGESMTCLCADTKDTNALAETKKIFYTVGATIEIPEELMNPATALCACGTAFFLRAIRAASQGGIEIGFHAEDALLMAAQTAKGAAAILLHEKKHPEREIDKVTTPQGITIAGLNQMEHNGFSSSMIKGIVTAAEKAEKIYLEAK